LFQIYKQEDLSSVQLFENSQETPEKQNVHTLEVSKFLETELKTCLEGLARNLFGKGTVVVHNIIFHNL
jgi:hypothetical protein